MPRNRLLLLAALFLSVAASLMAADKLFTANLSVTPPPLAGDKSVTYDFDIVYVRAPRQPNKNPYFAEVASPRYMDPGSELMLLHPDGSEEVLVPVQPHESIADPMVSFDGQSVYYVKFNDLRHPDQRGGSDIYRVNVKTKKTTQLTKQAPTPNTGLIDGVKAHIPPVGVSNLGPCPLPGGKVVFVSDRNYFKATNHANSNMSLALQLYVMDDDGSNVECIGHLNLGSALHPVVLKDGRIMFSTLESQGLRSGHLWGLWSIHPDGTNWGPLMSAFEPGFGIGAGTADSLHFQTQLSDENIVVESYYNVNNYGFGAYFKFPTKVPEGTPGFGPGYIDSPRNPPVRIGRNGENGAPSYTRFPFSPFGIEALTPFVGKADHPAGVSVLNRPDSPRIGKFTHPASAPDNHMLTVWSGGRVGGLTSPGTGNEKPDAGIYLLKSGKPVEEPGQLRLVKNDPKYNEQWPRAVVPYQRIYGVAEPKRLPTLRNDGKQSAALPEGTPFGLVGTSSLYKRESFPHGVVPPGKVTAVAAAKADPTGYRGFDRSANWVVQGGDAGLYANEDIVAIRILGLEPTTVTTEWGKHYNHAKERLRIIGEIPVRKFGADGKQPLDPDKNPDTSFLAKIPADVAWTFQTLDKHGMVLNSSQTWHQLRPGEIRHDCGGCHAHSQKPTLFEHTAAAKSDYTIWDLTEKTPLLTSKAKDESGKKWDLKDETGLRFHKGMKDVEYHRDIRPIFERSCVACHSHKLDNPAGKLVLDNDKIIKASNPAGASFHMDLPATYVQVAADPWGQHGHKPVTENWNNDLGASRYVKMMQARRSFLIWKIFGKRLDGFTNDDYPHETVPGDRSTLRFKGKPADPRMGNLAQIGYTGGIMPPPEAVEGTYELNGKKIKVAPLSEEDKLTLIRWVDLGCPIDFDYNPKTPTARGRGWLLDDQRPTLTLAHPLPGGNETLTRILVGMTDRDTGLDPKSFTVVADFPLDGVPAGRNLAAKFKALPDSRWELVLAKPLTTLPKGKITVSIKDRQGNTTKIERTISVGASTSAAK